MKTLLKYLQNPKVVLILIALLFIVFYRELLPFNGQMFKMHDVTQVARLEDFVKNITTFHIPPRISPYMSFMMGYPVFNYYAPTAYILSTPLAMLFGAMYGLKLSFLLAAIVGFAGMYVFMRRLVQQIPASISAFLYTFSPYIATEVYVRGNIAEMWLSALLPWTLIAFDKARETREKRSVLAFILIFALLITSHNALSIVAGGIVVVYALLQLFDDGYTKALKKGLMSSDVWVFLVLPSALAVGLASYFLIPFVFELSQTHAVSTAIKSVYSEHFVCLSQLWSSPLGYGGSTQGCVSDGMSFQIGKIVLFLGSLGFALTIYTTFFTLKQRKRLENSTRMYILFSIVGVGGMFMTTELSRFIWVIFEDVLSIYQFPWRFLLFGLFGLSILSGYTIETLIRPLKSVQKYYPLLLLLVIIIVAQGIMYGSFFKGQNMTSQTYSDSYASQTFKDYELVQRIPEYLPISVDPDAYFSYARESRSFPDVSGIIDTRDNGVVYGENKSGYVRTLQTSSKHFFVNIHYAPYWKIYIDGEHVIPYNFDPLGRPEFQLKSSGEHSVKIVYAQTSTQQFANVLTILVIWVLAYLYKPWQKKKKV